MKRQLASAHTDSLTAPGPTDLSAHSPYLVASHSWLRLATSTERVLERWPIGDREAAEIAVRA